MDNVLFLRLKRDGIIYVIEKYVNGQYIPSGWYYDLAKAKLAIKSLAYCYNCEIKEGV